MISLKIFLFFTVLTGIIYPLVITGIAQVVFPEKANGGMIVRNNVTVGSKLIGQQFDSVIYFTSRPSVGSYNPLPSGGSNYGLTNVKLKNLVAERRNQFIEFNRLNNHTAIPSEMVFASASGLDPHISPEAALLQVERITQARKFDQARKQMLVQYIYALTEKPQFLCLGEDRINVLLLNLKLDEIK